MYGYEENQNEKEKRGIRKKKAKKKNALNQSKEAMRNCIGMDHRDANHKTINIWKDLRFLVMDDTGSEDKRCSMKIYRRVEGKGQKKLPQGKMRTIEKRKCLEMWEDASVISSDGRSE